MQLQVGLADHVIVRVLPPRPELPFILLGHLARVIPIPFVTGRSIRFHHSGQERSQDPAARSVPVLGWVLRAPGMRHLPFEDLSHEGRDRVRRRRRGSEQRNSGKCKNRQVEVRARERHA